MEKAKIIYAGPISFKEIVRQVLEGEIKNLEILRTPEDIENYLSKEKEESPE